MLEMPTSANSTPSQIHYSLTDPNIDSVKAQLNMDCSGTSLTGGEKGEAKCVLKDQAPTAFQTLRMQASHFCHQDYVIFDKSDGQNTVICHPSWLQGPSHHNSVGPSSMWEVNRFLDSLQVLKSNPVEATFCLHSQAALSTLFWNTTPTEQKLSKTKDCHLEDGTRCETPNDKKQGLEATIEYKSQDSVFNESTEEINALLSSDDELSSTGHSPGEEASYSCSQATMNRCSISMTGKKRKFEGSAMDEGDDADSRAVYTPLAFGRSDSRQFPVSSKQKHTCSGAGGIDTFGNSKRSRICVSAPASAHQAHLPVTQSFRMPGGGGLLNTPKRIGLKGNVRKLKNVIPGGSLLDTAGVLGRTVQYVKCLQNKLRDLEAARESASMMHQIG